MGSRRIGRSHPGEYGNGSVGGGGADRITRPPGLWNRVGWRNRLQHSDEISDSLRIGRRRHQVQIVSVESGGRFPIVELLLGQDGQVVNRCGMAGREVNGIAQVLPGLGIPSTGNLDQAQQVPDIGVSRVEPCSNGQAALCLIKGPVMPLGLAEKTPGHRISLIRFNSEERTKRPLHLQPLTLLRKKDAQIKMRLGEVAILLQGLQIGPLSLQRSSGAMIGEPKDVPNPGLTRQIGRCFLKQRNGLGKLSGPLKLVTSAKCINTMRLATGQ